jgi:hypothetical protein
VPSRLTRSRFLGGLATLLAGAVAAPGAAFAARRYAPRLDRIAVGNGGRPYEGDRRLFATVSPDVPGRDTAIVAFDLFERARVRLDVIRTARTRRQIVATVEQRLDAGAGQIIWEPDVNTHVGSYLLRLTVLAPGRAPRVYGGPRPLTPAGSQCPVVRVLGVEAACDRRSYAPGNLIRLSIFSDARRLTLGVLHSGPEAEYTTRDDAMSGVLVDKLVTLPWRKHRNAPETIRLRVGDWPTGVYAVRLTKANGVAGFAPFVLRPATLGGSRQAVVIPTNTWQAYNFYDTDGDGYGDTWYAGGNPPVVLTRPYRDGGVPPRFHQLDAPFLHWLSIAGKTPDFLCDDDLETFASGDELRRLYDLVVFHGHTEYETAHAYDVIQRFRDLGGRLIFLSADAFYWKIDRTPDAIHRTKAWRELGRPEAALLGAQYRGNDDGSHQAVFQVRNAAAVPWLFEDTDVVDGSTIGDAVGGYGIEIDATAPQSPPGTVVIAEIPDVFGPGRTAQMTYYETPAGSRVFDAGAMDFCGSVLFEPMNRMLLNLWAHMTS